MQVRPGGAPYLCEVESETDPEKWYQVFANGTVLKCTCKGSLNHRTCKHLGIVQAYVRETGGGIEEEETGAPLQGSPGLSRWIKKIHGRDSIQYAGLLAMAHEQGLQEPAAEFISVTADLALAAAHVFFADGRKCWESGDATSGNLHQQVRPHFPRVALTRAKARVLRDALNIGAMAVEELDEAV